MEEGKKDFHRILEWPWPTGMLQEGPSFMKKVKRQLLFDWESREVCVRNKKHMGCFAVV